MQHLADLLSSIPLPAVEVAQAAGGGPQPRRLADSRLHLGEAAELVHDLGADLPAGHLHVWGGPSGAGKTSFLLSLLHAAAARGRRVTYATYDLAPESLALRLLAMAAEVDVDALPDPGGSAADCTLPPPALERVHAAHAALSRLPFSFLAARGLSVASIEDRLVRMPFRAEVLAVDYLQGVIRESGTEMGVALRALSDLAAHLHVAIICAVRPQEGYERRPYPSAKDAVSSDPAWRIPDRLGWIAPIETSGGQQETRSAEGGEGIRCSAEVVHNRYGERPSIPLELDEANGALGPSRNQP